MAMSRRLGSLSSLFFRVGDISHCGRWKGPGAIRGNGYRGGGEERKSVSSVVYEPGLKMFTGLHSESKVPYGKS